MKLSVKSRYALEALMEIGRAEQAGGRPATLRAVAERRGVSEPFLGQLLAVLVKAGILDGLRGAQGGYRLARPPEEITAGDVVRALEGPLAPVPCVLPGAADAPGCTRMERCVTRDIWQSLSDGIDEVLDGIRLDRLLTCCGENSTAADAGKPERGDGI